MFSSFSGFQILYCVASRRIPYEDIICNVEDYLVKNNIRKEDLIKSIRQNVSLILRMN